MPLQDFRAVKDCTSPSSCSAPTSSLSAGTVTRASAFASCWMTTCGLLHDSVVSKCPEGVTSAAGEGCVTCATFVCGRRRGPLSIINGDPPEILNPAWKVSCMLTPPQPQTAARCTAVSAVQRQMAETTREQPSGLATFERMVHQT